MSSSQSIQELKDEIQRLQRENQELKVSLESTDLNLQKSIQYGHLLASISTELVDFSDDDIYQFCANNLKKILPNSTVMVSAFDQKENVFALASMNGVTKKQFNLLKKLLGDNLLEAKADFNNLDKPVQESLFSQELRENPGGIHLATGHVFPEKICRCAETLFGITGVYGMGLSWDNKLYGAVAIFSMGDDENIRLVKELIEIIVRMVSIAMQRQQAQETIKKALKDKELLVKETHHRTKNNLMIMSSLLRLQSQQITDQQTRALLDESRDRAKSMALIHERLYNSENLKSIDFGEYLSALVLNLFRYYITHNQLIKLTTNIDNYMMDINNAVPMGLIANELVTNALKYAFPDNVEGELTVEFYSYGDILKLIIKDDGVGLPDDFDFEGSTSFGLQIVKMLTSQIDGEIIIDSNKGTSITVIIKEIEY